MTTTSGNNSGLVGSIKIATNLHKLNNGSDNNLLISASQDFDQKTNLLLNNYDVLPLSMKGMKNDDFSSSLSLLTNPNVSLPQQLTNNLACSLIASNKMVIDPVEQSLASLEQSIIGNPAAVAAAASCLPPNILNHLNLPIPMPFDNSRNDNISNKQDIEMVDNHQFFMPNLNNNSDNNQRSSLSNNQSRPVPLLTTSHGIHNTNNSYNQMELNGPNLLESFHQQQLLHTNNDNSNLISASGLNSIFDSNMTTIAPTMTSSSSSSNQTKDVMKNSSMQHHQQQQLQQQQQQQQHPGKHQSQSMSSMSNIPLASPAVMTSMHSNNSQQSKKDESNQPPPPHNPSSQQQQQQPPPQQQLLIKPIETMMPSPQDRHKHSPPVDMKSFNFSQSMKHAAEQNLKNASSWSSLAITNSPQSTPISAKSKPSSMDSFQQFKFKAKEKADRLKLLEAQELKRTQKEAAEKKHLEHQKHKGGVVDLELIR